MQLQPIARGLIEGGHRVFAALKDLSRAGQIFGPKVLPLQAPTKTRSPQRHIVNACSFAHILHNSGYESVGELSAMVVAWRGLFALARPDLMIFDHSPTALLAARGVNAKKVIVGSGFCIPPDESPLPNLRPWVKIDLARLREDEQRVLATMNRVLKNLRQPPLERITQLYSEVDDTLLLTYPELDHYPNRKNARGLRLAARWLMGGKWRLGSRLGVVPGRPECHAPGCQGRVEGVSGRRWLWPIRCCPTTGAAYVDFRHSRPSEQGELQPRDRECGRRRPDAGGACGEFP